jgi:hypothetical protein
MQKWLLLTTVAYLAVMFSGCAGPRPDCIGLARRGFTPDFLRSPEDQKVYAALGIVRNDLIEFNGEPLSRVIEYLRATCEINIVQKFSEDGEDPTVSILTNNLTLERYVDALCVLSGTSWVVEKGSLVIGPPALVEKFEMRFYDVGDLIAGFMDGSANGSAESAARELITCIRTVCGKDPFNTWAQRVFVDPSEVLKYEEFVPQKGRAFWCPAHPDEIAIVQMKSVHGEIGIMLKEWREGIKRMHPWPRRHRPDTGR